MKYTNYKNIAVEEFNLAKERLEQLELLIDHWLSDHAPEFYVNRLHTWEESLSINLNSRIPPFKVNIAIMYQDQPGPQTYSIGIVKTIDKEKRRYFKKKKILENASLEIIEEKIEELLQTAIDECNSWTENDLTEFIEKGQGAYYPKGKGKGLKRIYPPENP